jgi:hypothetical protein
VGGNTASLNGITASAPYWVRLSRAGNLFTGSTSPDGVTWTIVGQVKVKMSKSVSIGLAATAGSTTALNTGTASNVAFTGDVRTGIVVNRQADVFYFGNAIGDMNSGNVGSPITVRTNATDTAIVQQDQSIKLNSVDVSSIHDLNKDGRVNETDTAIVRQNQLAEIIGYFDAPASFSAASGRVSADGVVTLQNQSESTKVVTLNDMSVDVVFQAVGSAMDANDEGNKGPLDVLNIINFINSDRSTSEYVQSLDANKDGVISPLDVLCVINEINEINRSGNGEGEGNAIQAFAQIEDLLGVRLKRKDSRRFGG